MEFGYHQYALTNEETDSGIGQHRRRQRLYLLTLMNSGIIDANQSVPLTIQAAGGVAEHAEPLRLRAARRWRSMAVTITNTGGTLGEADTSVLPHEVRLLLAAPVTLDRCVDSAGG